MKSKNIISDFDVYYILIKLNSSKALKDAQFQKYTSLKIKLKIYIDTDFINVFYKFNLKNGVCYEKLFYFYH